MAVEISDWNDLDNVRNDLSGDYVLVNDLDSETGGYAGIGDDFEPIGYIDGEGGTSEFDGSFDGGGFAIDDLIIDFGGTGASEVGLFASTDSGALIENLSVSGSVTGGDGSDFFGNSRAGGVVGNHAGGTIQNCVSHVDVTSDGERVGGLVGDNADTVTESYATGSVEGGDQAAGGLVGFNNDTVTDSHATGSVEGDERVGGLVGDNGDTVTDSYATASVEGDERVGGLVGQNRDTIQTSYAVGLVTGNEDVGGLCSDPFDNGTVTDSYWDTETTGQSTSDGGTGLTTAEMQGSAAETNMDGFDFANTWDTVLESDEDATADGYPILLAVNRDDQLDAQGILVPFDLSVQTNAATDIGNFAATLNGELVELDDEAEDADVFFEFGETVGQNQTPTQTLTEPATFDELIDELEPNTTFEFRAVAEAQDEENETFTDEGDILTFSTEIVTLDGTISLDDAGVENADVIVHNFTQDVFEGRLSTDADGNYAVDLPDADRLDTVAVAVDFDDGTERYGRVVTTVLE